MKLYLDTNVWIDYLDGKRENHADAVKLFDMIKKEGHVVVVTELHIYETKVHGYYESFECAKNKLWQKGLCFGLKLTLEDKEKAKKLDNKLNCGKADCLHVIAAKRADAVLVSSDSDWVLIALALGMENFDYSLFFKRFKKQQHL